MAKLRTTAAPLLIAITAAASWIPAVCQNASADESKEFRLFTDAKGRTVEARMVSVFEAQAKIELKQGGQVVTWPVSAFSAGDQDYMKKWATENISYRFVVRHRTETAIPRKPVTGMLVALPFPGGRNNVKLESIGIGKAPPKLRDSQPGGGINVNDDDSELQFLTLSVSNGSSAALKDVDVAVWVVLSQKRTHKKEKDTSRFIANTTSVRLPSIAVGEKIDLAGGFPVKKIRLKDRVATVNTRTETSSITGLPTEYRTTTYSNDSVGSLRETVSGVLVRVYHDGKLVDEVTDFDSDFKNSDQKLDFSKPATSVARPLPTAR